MRRAYSAQADSAHAGRRLLTATTRSLGTRFSPGRAACAAGRLGGRLEAHRLAAPDLLEIVEVPRRRMHDVDHHVAEIHQDPFAVRLALDGVNAGAERLELGARGDRQARR